jgi:hypothetical protein
MEDQFLNYCRNHLCLNIEDFKYYPSVALCALDACYSINAKYSSVINVVWNFSKWVDRSGFTIDKILTKRIPSVNNQLPVSSIYNLIDVVDNATLAHDICKNDSRSGGVLKAALFRDVLSIMIDNHIETYHDYQISRDNIRDNLSAIPGIGPATISYLNMLTGDQNYVKIDRHIKAFVHDAIGRNANANEIVVLFHYAADRLSDENRLITARHLDHIVWVYQSNQ